MGESDHCYFFACKKAVVDVLTANSEYDINLAICTFCMTMKSLSCFVRINKLNRNYSYCQILSLVCPLKYHTTLLLSHGL